LSCSFGSNERSAEEDDKGVDVTERFKVIGDRGILMKTAFEVGGDQNILISENSLNGNQNKDEEIEFCVKKRMVFEALHERHFFSFCVIEVFVVAFDIADRGSFRISDKDVIEEENDDHDAGDKDESAGITVRTGNKAFSNDLAIFVKSVARELTDARQNEADDESSEVHATVEHGVRDRRCLFIREHAGNGINGGIEDTVSEAGDSEGGDNSVEEAGEEAVSGSADRDFGETED